MSTDRVDLVVVRLVQELDVCRERSLDLIAAIEKHGYPSASFRTLLMSAWVSFAPADARARLVFLRAGEEELNPTSPLAHPHERRIDDDESQGAKPPPLLRPRD